ncbi:MAG: hypothetical protein IPJ87_03815 [Flavobacteriales bacterium]|jgi:hypothetical protein|nr:hypothetical protein [Flavobacteriales bacterium]MBK7940994.1 hypothetical protein [Flavobacteriales bacterium]MBK8949724.1 hypothetical protein [Flavobacteriales bacterium]MBK9701582.1 hypothetical protein [Flavobacteriales bacterium]
MKRAAWAGMLVATVASAQEPALPAEPRWSASVDLVGPVRSVIAADDALPFLQLDAALQRWAWGDVAWRVGYGHVNDRWEEPRDVLVVVDSLTFEQEHIVAREQVHAMRVGAVVQHRDRVFAPSAGFSLVLGVERQQALRTATGLTPDTVPCTDCVLVEIPGYTSRLNGDRRDVWGNLGLEAALAMSWKLGHRIELEARVPVQLRWRFLVDSAITGTAPEVEAWAQPWRVGVGFPALFVHVRW